MQQDEPHVILLMFGLGAGVGLGPSDGQVEERDEGIWLVASGSESIEKHSSFGSFVGFVSAKGVNSEQVAKNYASDESWWVGGVGRDVEV